METKKHYYVVKYGRCLSDYTDYEVAKKHADLVDGNVEMYIEEDLNKE